MARRELRIDSDNLSTIPSRQDSIASLSSQSEAWPSQDVETPQQPSVNHSPTSLGNNPTPSSRPGLLGTFSSWMGMAESGRRASIIDKSETVSRSVSVASESTEAGTSSISVDEQDIGLLQMYEAIDKTHEGRITVATLRNYITGLAICRTDDELKEIIARMDSGKVGEVTFDDFKNDFRARWSNARERNHMLVEIFKLLDLTGDGEIAPKEVRATMLAMGEKVTPGEIEEMFKLFDNDESGEIDLNEFLRAITKHLETTVGIQTG